MDAKNSGGNMRLEPADSRTLVGTIGGIYMSGKIITDVPGLPHARQHGLFIFAVHEDGHTKMVGYLAGEWAGGRNHIAKLMPLDAASITDTWDSADNKDVPEHGYKLSDVRIIPLPDTPSIRCPRTRNSDPARGWVLLHSGWIPSHAASIEPWIASKGQFTTKADESVAPYNQVFLDGDRCGGAHLRRVLVLDQLMRTPCPFSRGQQSMPAMFNVQQEICFPGDQCPQPFSGPHRKVNAWEMGNSSGWQELHQINGGRFIIRKDQIHMCADYAAVGGENNNPRLGRYGRVWVRNSATLPTELDLPCAVIMLPDYDSSKLPEALGSLPPPVTLRHHAFEISMTITPTAARYGMLASHDRSGEGRMQFRLEIYPSMKVSLACEGTGMRGGRTDGDSNGWRSELCTPTLPLNEQTCLRVTRDNDGRFQLFVNDTLVSEYRSGPPADLGIGSIADRTFRIGSRFPPSRGSELHDAYAGSIRDACLRIARPA